MSLELKQLRKRIIEISYKLGLSHISSCLTSVGIINEIYKIKKEDEPFILSCGQAGLALYVVIEKYYGLNAEEIYLESGTHPNRSLKNKLFYSTGSLGCGLPASLGFAFSNRNRNSYCLISDGEYWEGSIHESLNTKNKYNVDNLKVYCNINGFSALEPVNVSDIIYKLSVLDKNIQIRLTDHKELPFLNGVESHYHVLNKEEYEKALEIYA